MTGQTGTLTISSRMIPWAVGCFGLLAVGSALLVTATDEVWQRALFIGTTVALGVLTVRSLRLRLRCDDAGITSLQLVRSVTYPWSAVDRIGVADGTIIGARLADGRWVHLLHYRGLGDPSTTRAAEDVDRELGTRASNPLTLNGWTRRPPPPRWMVLVLSALLVAVVLTYAILTGNWVLIVFLGVQVVLQRKYGDQAGRTYCPVGTGTHRDQGRRPE